LDVRILAFGFLDNVFMALMRASRLGFAVSVTETLPQGEKPLLRRIHERLGRNGAVIGTIWHHHNVSHSLKELNLSKYSRIDRDAVAATVRLQALRYCDNMGCGLRLHGGCKEGQ
jgi:hypothetical protein